jgi:hypothetical protein
MSEKEISGRRRWRLGVMRYCEGVTEDAARTARHFGISEGLSPGQPMPKKWHGSAAGSFTEASQ